MKRDPKESGNGAGTTDDPWVLTTPPGTSSYTMYRDEQADPPTLVCQVGSTTLSYHLRAIDDLHARLHEQGDWVPLGAADEQKPAADGTVEAWGRSADNPVGGWYGLARASRPLRHVPAAAARGARAGRGHARRPQQPDARALGAFFDGHVVQPDQLEHQVAALPRTVTKVSS